MSPMFAFSHLATAALGLAAVTNALATIEGKGAKLFTSDGNQFFIKGIAYQLTDDDPLVDTAQCLLDAALMQTIGTNSIRVYHVDATADHDGCMSAFSDAGIYTWIDLDTFSTYILASAPAWNQSQYDAYSAVMDTFQGYDNVAGFFVGNEILTDGADSPAAPYVKAAIRDMKAYRDTKGYRTIPIGYSAADITALRPNLQNYLACGTSDADRADFFSLNAYEWCGDSTFEESGYTYLEQNATSYNIPLFFSETGCNTPAPRLFSDQAAILGPDMNENWSGAIIYEWIEETNNYGLISYGPEVSATATASNVVDGYTRGGTPTPVSSDWTNLSGQWATLSPTGTSMSAYTPSNSPPACPSYTSGLWEVSGDVTLPTLGQVLSEASTTSTGTQTTSGSSTGTKGTSSKSTASSTKATASTTAASGASSRDRTTLACILGVAGSLLAFLVIL